MRQMSIPDSYSLYKLLLELLKSSDVAFNQGAYSLGMKMMEPGLRVSGEVVSLASKTPSDDFICPSRPPVAVASAL